MSVLHAPPWTGFPKGTGDVFTMLIAQECPFFDAKRLQERHMSDISDVLSHVFAISRRPPAVWVWVMLEAVLGTAQFQAGRSRERPQNALGFLSAHAGFHDGSRLLPSFSPAPIIVSSVNLPREC